MADLPSQAGSYYLVELCRVGNDRFPPAVSQAACKVTVVAPVRWTVAARGPGHDQRRYIECLGLADAPDVQFELQKRSCIAIRAHHDGSFINSLSISPEPAYTRPFAYDANVIRSTTHCRCVLPPTGSMTSGRRRAGRDCKTFGGAPRGAVCPDGGGRPLLLGPS